MKNILSRWILLLLSAIILPACNDETEPNNPIPDATFQKKLAMKPWQGMYGYTDGALLSVNFNQDGSGIMEYTGDKETDPSLTQTYRFSYKVNEPYVECQGTLTSSQGTKTSGYEMKFEVRENRLFPLSDEFKMFVLGQKETIKTNSYGVIINDIPLYSNTGLGQIWIHENGLNILDLRETVVQGHPILLHLKKKEEKWFDFYTNDSWFDSKTYLLHSIGKEWRVIDCTYDKLILQGENGLEIFHPGSASDLPQITDYKEIICSSNKWIKNNDAGHCIWCLTLNPDSTFNIVDDGIVIGEGTYYYSDEEIIFKYTKCIAEKEYFDFDKNYYYTKTEDIAPCQGSIFITDIFNGIVEIYLSYYGRYYVLPVYDPAVWNL